MLRCPHTTADVDIDIDIAPTGFTINPGVTLGDLGCGLP